jgi:5-hydroxyisourate hydrolase
VLCRAGLVFLLPGVLSVPVHGADPARRAPISTHVLNTATGKPGAGIAVTLERQAASGWERLGQGKTDADGRVGDLYPAGKPLQTGAYRLLFETGAYFKAQGQKTFFPRVEVLFQVEKADEHYHVPLLLSPFSYSTYRGS